MLYQLCYAPTAWVTAALSWSSDGGSSFREIVRQQWNFSPPATVRESEEYRVELSNVTVIELKIVPNMNGGSGSAVAQESAFVLRRDHFAPDAFDESHTQRKCPV